jgi:hypothetical protein
MKRTRVSVVQDAEKPVEVSVLAQSIVDISAAAKRLAQSGLSRKAVVILLAHHCGLGQGTVKAVLDGIEELQATYLKR